MKEVNKRNPERCLCRNILEDLRKLKFNFNNISMNKKKKKNTIPYTETSTQKHKQSIKSGKFLTNYVKTNKERKSQCHPLLTKHEI